MFPDFAAKCTIEYLTGGKEGEMVEKMRLALAANENIADINQLNYTQVGEFTRAGALQSLDEIVGPVRNDMLNGFRLMTEYEGKTVSIPTTINAKLWFYRKDLFDQAGIDPAKVRNLDDFIAAGKKLQTLNPKYRMWNHAATNPAYNYMMILSGTDASFADKDGKFLLTSNPNFKKMLEAYKKLIESGVVSPTRDWTPDWERAFSDEVIVSIPNATWMSNTSFLPTYAGEAQKGKWYATQWPSFMGEVGGSEAGGAVYVMPVYAKETELAKEYMRLRFLTKEGSFLQTKIGRPPIPMLKSWVDDPRTKEADPYIAGDYIGETIKAIDTFRIFPWDPAAQLELELVTPYFDQAVNGKMSIDNALKNAQADLETQIGNPWDR
jgi:ABC-type glycerol-3-phosphate transport system substrate-binding protein